MLAFGLIAVLLFHRNLAGARRLIWRARWLFLLLGVGYAYSLPGPVGIPVLGHYSPSVPGLWLGGKQMLRLFLLLWLLDGLVVSMPEKDLMAGLYNLFAFVRRIGFPVERTTVRLALTLRAMEGNLVRRRSLREACAIPEQVEEGGSLELRIRPWRVQDSVVLLLALIVLVGIWRV